MTDEPIDGDVAEVETVDGEPVSLVPILAEVRPIERVVPAAPAILPAVQAAAAAATGFVAGAATLAVMHRFASRKLARVQPPTPTRRQLDWLPVVSSRTFIVDVHLIGKPGE